MSQTNNQEVLQKLLLEHLSEEKLNKMICSALDPDLSVLKEVLKLKYSAVLHGKQERFNFPITSLLRSFNISESQCFVDVLKYALLVQKDNREHLIFHDFLVSSMKSVVLELDYFLMVFHLLEVALTLIENYKFELKIEQFENLPTFYKSVCCFNSRKLMPFINEITKRVLPTIGRSNVLNCFDAILASDNMSVLCLTINYFLTCDSKSAIFSLLHQHDIWAKIDNLVCSYETTSQRQGTFLLQQMKDFVLSNKLFSEPGSDYIKMAECSLKDTEIAWNSFFILLHMSKEKQIHLVKPSLTFLQDLFCLHPLWVKTVNSILLSHAQIEVVLSVAESLLSSKWFKEFDKFLLLHKFLLEALSKIDYSKGTIDTFTVLGKYLLCCPDEVFWLVLEESVEMSWNPLNMWLFCKNAFKTRELQSFNCGTICAFLSHLQKLPHKYIRSGCLFVCMKFISNVWDMNKLNFENILKIATIFYGSEVPFQNFTNTFANIILHYQIEIENEINSTFAPHLEIVLQLWKTFDPEGSDIFKKRDSNKFPALVLLKIVNTFDLLIAQIDSMLIFNCLGNLLDFCEKQLLEDAKLLIEKISSNTVYCESYRVEIAHLCSAAEAEVAKNIASTQTELALRILKSFKIYFSFTELCSFACKIADTREESLLIEFLEILSENVTEDSVPILINLVEKVYENGSDKTVAAVIKHLVPVLSKTRDEDTVHKILQSSIEQILRLQRGELFVSTLEAYLEAITDVKSVHEIASAKCYEVARLVLELSKKLSSAGYILIQHLRRLVDCCPQDAGMYCDIFIECLLSDVCVKKEERSEYDVCKDIRKCMRKINVSSVEDQHMLSRYLIFESILLLINNNRLSSEDKIKLADNLASILLTRYKAHFNKRYFKDSTLHMQKLRTIQALLLLQPCISALKDDVLNLVLASVCSESHQHCVRQLIVLLLTRLLHENEKAIHIVIETLEGAASSKVSTVSALIPVLYHITLLSSCEDVWLAAMGFLQQWTMGANFKLRVYAQVSMCNLYEKAVERRFIGVVEGYKNTYECIRTLFSKSNDTVQRTLQTDEIIYNSFDSIEHYSLETILIHIPKINAVAKSEWEGYSFLELTHFRTIKGKNISSETFLRYSEKANEAHKSEKPIDIAEIIQRKMTPWDELIEEKSLTNLVVVASFVDKTANVGGLSRTCEIFGVKELVVNDAKVVNDKEYKSLSMCSEGWLNLREVKRSEIKDFLIKMKLEGYAVVAAEQTSKSVRLHGHAFQEKTVLLLGNEKEGIPSNVLPLADVCVEIPQIGVTRSLNVHVAGSLFIWEYSKCCVLK